MPDDQIPHDVLFKLLITNFFDEFMELFFPEVASQLEKKSFELLPSEFLSREKKSHQRVDLLFRVKSKGSSWLTLIHIEQQAKKDPRIHLRMLEYLVQIMKEYSEPVFPILLLSYDAPFKPEDNQFSMTSFDESVLSFKYQVIQLNQFNWKDFRDHPNPVANVLMSKMKITPKDRPRVKLACLRLIARQKYEPEKMKILADFIDIYLKLNPTEEEVFMEEIAQLPEQEQHTMMDITNSWEKRGIEIGIEQGIRASILEGLAIKFEGEDISEVEAILQAKSDPSRLNETLKWVFRCGSMQEFKQKLVASRNDS